MADTLLILAVLYLAGAGAIATQFLAELRGQRLRNTWLAAVIIGLLWPWVVFWWFCDQEGDL